MATSSRTTATINDFLESSTFLALSVYYLACEVTK